MVLKVKTTKTVEAKYLKIDAGVRYWEDSTVNGTEDTEDGKNIPLKDGDRWKLKINLDSGVIEGWKQGTTAEIHYKVCDDGVYSILDKEENEIEKLANCYVLDMLDTSEQGFGDYIIFNIDKDGKIEGFKPSFSEFKSVICTIVK